MRIICTIEMNSKLIGIFSLIQEVMYPLISNTVDRQLFPLCIDQVFANRTLGFGAHAEKKEEKKREAS